MIVLGIDPGYRNLGLAILRVTDYSAEVVWSSTMSVGSATRGMDFAKILWPHLDNLDTTYGIEGIASETAPFIQRQIKTTALLWAVTAIISAWAVHKGIPFKHASPMTLKRATCRALKIPWSRKFIPKKKDIKLVVKQYCDTSGRTNHEDDAALSAILLYTNLIPQDGAVPERH